MIFVWLQPSHVMSVGQQWPDSDRTTRLRQAPFLSATNEVLKQIMQQRSLKKSN